MMRVSTLHAVTKLTNSQWALCRSLIPSVQCRHYSIQSSNNYRSHTPSCPQEKITRSTAAAAHILSSAQYGIASYPPHSFSCRYKSDVTVPSPPPAASPITDAGLVSGGTEIIPEPPSAEVADVVIQQLTALGEPTLSSLGLVTNTPSGFVRYLLENIHVYADLPWWGTFAAFAVALRLVMMPVQAWSLRQNVKAQNTLPEYQKLATQYQQALQSSNTLKAMHIEMKLKEHTAKHGMVKPYEVFLPSIVQFSVFASCLTAIRGLANLPVESMMTGGTLWFTDLTIADPYCLLPLMTASTLLLNLELGAEGLSTKTLSTKAKWGMRAGVCIFIPALMIYQSSALAVYWFFSNTLAVTVSSLMKTPKLKAKLGIPDIVKRNEADKHTKPTTETKWEQMKRSIQENRIQAAKGNEELANAQMFRDAAQQAKVKTFKYDPTKAAVSKK